MRELLSALVPANPFYTRKLAGEELAKTIASREEFFRKVPFTRKAELSAEQLALPPFGTNLTYSLERYSRWHQTSGTTGSPITWLDTPESWQWMVDSWKEVFAAAEVTSVDRIFFTFSFGPFIGFWLAFEAAAQMGCLCFPGGGLHSAARAQIIAKQGITVLCCTPTYAIRLAEIAAEEKIDLSQANIKVLIAAGEPGASIPATRNRLETLWPGTRVFDHHGMTEVGPVTYECPTRPCTLFVMESAYLAEVIEPDTGQPVSPGKTGELVLTTLGRTGSPVLRYRTGDLVKPVFIPPSEYESPTNEGSPQLGLEGGILGRVDDMVLVRGVNIFPSAVEDVIRQHGGVAEYQVRIRNAQTMAEMSVRVEPLPGWGNPKELVRQLEKCFYNAFSLRITVASAAPGSLPRFEFKSHRWKID